MQSLLKDLRQSVLRKKVESFDYFCKALYLRSFTRFYIGQSLNKYLLTCRITSRNALYETYSEHCDIRNSYTFRTRDTFRTISRHFLVYSECCVTLVHWQLCNIHSCNPVYLDIFKHIQAYSIMIVIIALNFFFHINLTYFSTKFRKTSGFFFTVLTSIIMLDRVYLNSTRSLKIALL